MNSNLCIDFEATVTSVLMTSKHAERSVTWRQKIAILYRSLTDPDVPWYVKFLVGFIVAYIISPIDIIPDFIPVLGLLDEAILVPIGIALAFKLMPEQVINKYREEDGEPFSKVLLIVGSLTVLLFWLAAILCWILIFV